MRKFSGYAHDQSAPFALPEICSLKASANGIGAGGRRGLAKLKGTDNCQELCYTIPPSQDGESCEYWRCVSQQMKVGEIQSELRADVRMLVMIGEDVSKNARVGWVGIVDD